MNTENKLSNSTIQVMNPKIAELFSEGDYFLKEAKSDFLVKDENQCDAISSTNKSIRKYLDAYESSLFEHLKPTENYHVLIHYILQKDPEFINFSEKIYEIKCFAEESKANSEGFFLYSDEINDILKNVMEVRNYIAKKVNLTESYLSNFVETSFMAI